ncbi:hypothetical protein [Mycetocola miduiensis]|uniref:Uncharacterized protein n=1 Tax=Mycetocola miduiensis TaxID=995034 RepID=A0A1I4ZV14_9MICO|nr:hypothetical protein [Mycetocola miduiensis]SFN54074.1 hypothetical protein SAMN05216219_1099 [Mycetocola miduiensis]
MSFATTLIAEAAHHAELPMPAIMYGVLALVVFSFLGVATFSYRDVSNRHGGRVAARERTGSNQGTGH